MTLMAGSSPGATEWFLRAKQMRQLQLSKLAQLGELVNGISRLVHMLQCERGASNVWLCSQGSFTPRNARPAGRWWTKTSPHFTGCLTSNPRCRAAPCERIASALLSLEGLIALRDGVSGQHIAAPMAMEHYSRMLRQLLSIVPQLNDSIDDPQIAGRFVALYSLMQVKSWWGRSGR